MHCFGFHFWISETITVGIGHLLWMKGQAEARPRG